MITCVTSFNKKDMIFSIRLDHHFNSQPFENTGQGILVPPEYARKTIVNPGETGQQVQIHTSGSGYLRY